MSEAKNPPKMTDAMMIRNVFFIAVFQWVVCLNWEVNTNAVKQHHRDFLIRLWKIRAFVYPITHSNLELEHLRCAEGINWANHRLGMRVTKALMPIAQRKHGTVDEGLEMVVDGRTTTGRCCSTSVTTASCAVVRSWMRLARNVFAN